MSKRETVSIYLPTRNRCDLLQRAVQSVLSQTHQEFDLIIVDDHSTDATRGYLETLAASDSRVTCLFKSDTSAAKGAQTSRNMAISKARGAYITGLDDDDYFHEDRLEQMLAAYDPKFSFVCSNHFSVSRGRCQPSSRIARRIGLQNLAIRNCVGNQVFTETHKVVQVGMFDPDMVSSQDLDLWLRLIKAYGPAFRLKEALYYQDVGHSDARISNSPSKAKGDRQLLAKHSDVITGGTLKFKQSQIGTTTYGLTEGPWQSLRQFGAKVTMERLRAKYRLG